MSRASSAFTFLRILQPSWHGALFTILGAVVAIAAIGVPSIYEGSLLDTYIETSFSTQTGIFTDYNRWNEAVNTSEVAGDGAVFVVWALIGLAGYYFLLSLFGAASNTLRFIHIVEYFKSDRKRIEAEALVKLCIRLAAIAGIYTLYQLIVMIILPYVLYFTDKSLLDDPFFATLYLLCAFMFVIVTIHILVVLIRLMLLRYRIFRSSDDTFYS